MRTTIYIRDDLIKEVKKLAADSHRTLTSIVEDALQETISRRKPQHSQNPVRLTTFGGNGLQPGVDLDDTASLTDLMEVSDAHDRR